MEDSKRRIATEPIADLSLSGQGDLKNTLKNRLALDNKELSNKFNLYKEVIKLAKK